MSMPEGAYTKLNGARGMDNTTLLHEAVKKAFEEGAESRANIYEDIVARMDRTINNLHECMKGKDAHIRKLYQIIEEQTEQIETMRKIIDRRDLPYDAMGDYSHHPQKNIYSGDGWYDENFRKVIDDE